MPTYDYECPKGHRFEAFQKMTDKPVAKCPRCGAKARRIISGGAGFLFKGEGFYITDYRSDDYKKRASSEAGDAAPASEPKAAASEGGDPVPAGDRSSAVKRPASAKRASAAKRASGAKRTSRAKRTKKRSDA